MALFSQRIDRTNDGNDDDDDDDATGTNDDDDGSGSGGDDHDMVQLLIQNMFSVNFCAFII